jgi:TolA-binding protein
MRLAMIAFLLAGTAVPAFAQSDQSSLPGRVDQLEHEMRAVQRKVFPGGNPTYFEPQISAPQTPPDQAGTPASAPLQDLAQRVTALEQQVQQITNQAEENDHRLTVLEQQYAKMKGDTDYRLNTLEGHGTPPGGAPQGDAGAQPPPAGGSADQSAPPFGPQGRGPVSGTPAPPPPAGGDTMGAEAAGAAPPVPAAPAAPAIAKTGDPAEDGYMQGYSLWTQKRYGDAEALLKQVVAKYPNHKRASYAQNLLGRAYLDDGQYSSAADAFLTSYKKFPRGERAPDSLFYLGQTLTKLGKNGQACQVYDEFRDVYGPTANATLKARVTQGRSDAKCGA